jgi:CubicO group peptidase (beta-lactamase class C family)
MPRVDQLEMRARVDEMLNRRPTVGMAVGVVRDGSVEFFYGHGVADIESNTPVTEDTMFRIASITKTFTAIAVMQLWEQGKVDLGAPANDYPARLPASPHQSQLRAGDGATSKDTDLVRSERVRSHLATGYDLRSNGAKPVTHREWVTAAASSIYSTPRDMARYLAALLGGGVNEHGSVLKPATLAIVFEPHYQPDPRIPGMGLAFSRGYLGSHRFVEHEASALPASCSAANLEP